MVCGSASELLLVRVPYFWLAHWSRSSDHEMSVIEHLSSNDNLWIVGLIVLAELVERPFVDLLLALISAAVPLSLAFTLVFATTRFLLALPLVDREVAQAHVD